MHFAGVWVDTMDMSPATSDRPDGPQGGRLLSEEQFVVLVARQERRVRSFLRTLLVPCQGMLDDLVQSTLVVAWKKLSTFSYDGESPDEEFVRWLCTIARFQAMAERRKSAKGPVAFSDALVDQLADLQIAQSKELNRRHEALAGCLEKLGDVDRQLLGKKYSMGLSAREIGAHLHRTETAVLNALSRLRRRLRECIEHALLRQEAQW